MKKSFMTKVNLWISHHEFLATAILTAIFSGIYVYLFNFEENVWFVEVLGCVFICFLCHRFAVSRKYLIHNIAQVKSYKTCDPGYLHDACIDQLKHTKNPVVIEFFENSLGICYLDMGEYQKAYDIFSSHTIDITVTNIKSSMKLNYNSVAYNNASCAAEGLKRYDEARELLAKAEACYDLIKNHEIKYGISEHLKKIEPSKLRLKGEYRKAVELYLDRESLFTSPREKVFYNLNVAECYIKLGEPENSRPYLEYVIANGNKLYAVTEAKEMLEQINANGSNE